VLLQRLHHSAGDVSVGKKCLSKKEKQRQVHVIAVPKYIHREQEEQKRLQSNIVIPSERPSAPWVLQFSVMSITIPRDKSGPL